MSEIEVIDLKISLNLQIAKLKLITVELRVCDVYVHAAGSLITEVQADFEAARLENCTLQYWSQASMDSKLKCGRFMRLPCYLTVDGWVVCPDWAGSSLSKELVAEMRAANCVISMGARSEKNVLSEIAKGSDSYDVNGHPFVFQHYENDRWWFKVYDFSIVRPGRSKHELHFEYSSRADTEEIATCLAYLEWMKAKGEIA